MANKIIIEYGEPVKFESDDYCLFIKVEYNAGIVEIMRRQPRAFYHIKSKIWEVPIIHEERLLEDLRFASVEFLNEKPKRVSKRISLPPTFRYKTKPFEHQRKGLWFGLKNSNWILADEPGLGKTKQVIDLAVAKKHEKPYKHALIICGVSGLKWNWVNEIEIHSNETATVLGARVNRKGQTVDDKVANRLKMLEDGTDHFFLVTNIETLRRPEIVEKLSAMCEDGTIGFVALDEAHKVRGNNSQQSRGLMQLRARNKVAMTGTPIVTKPLDSYVMLKWLGYEVRSYYAFEEYYAIKAGYITVGYKHIEDMTNLLQDIMLRRLKTDVYDLPEKVRMYEYVEMDSKQAKVYKEVLEQMQEMVDKIVLSPFPLSELTRLRQVTGNPMILTTQEVKSAKIERLFGILEDIVPSGEKVIVFSNWTQVLDRVAEDKRMQEYNPIYISGNTKQDDRFGLIEKFQNDEDTKVAIGTIDALGTGFTLTAASTVIFLDEPWDMATKEQAENRAHRIGTKKSVNIITLVTKDTIDEHVVELVKVKGAVSDLMVDREHSNDLEMQATIHKLLGL